MAYTLNGYFQLAFSTPNATRVVIYPNDTVAAQLRNYHTDKGAEVLRVADCLSDEDTRLPMPDALMNAIDEKVQTLDKRALIVGLDAYLSLLSAKNVTVFMSELRRRLDDCTLNADLLLSTHRRLGFAAKLMESRSVIIIEGNKEVLEPLDVQVYPDRWVRVGDANGYKELLSRISQYEPSGSYTLILPDLTGKQAGIGNAVSFVVDMRDVATRHYGIDVALDDTTLSLLLAQASENSQGPELYLENAFGTSNINTKLALKRLLELPPDNLWPAHIWALRKRLPSESYISKAISGEVTHHNLLRKYVVDSAILVLSDAKAKKYALERAEALKAINSNYESLIVEFIGQTRDSNNALQFLNCGTNAERIEIIRRASAENLTYGLPTEYAELCPALADYFSSIFDYGSNEVASYFNEYRKLKISNSITDSFVQLSYDFILPNSYAARDASLVELRAEPDTALLVVDAMGAEYMPLLLSLAKHRGMNIESQAVVVANLPSETEFNPIEWDASRMLPEIRNVDNIVHYGAAKHEMCTPERNLSATLEVFESEVMNRIADGLTSFPRVVVTADHGASKLAVTAHHEKKGKTLFWDKQKHGEPDNWRYSLAPIDEQRPVELDQEYFPETKKTYWIVRGYNRLPKQGGKLYELHGGASLEERLVPLVVFTRNPIAEIPEALKKEEKVEIVDAFEDII